MTTSIRAVLRNPIPMAVWGLIVAALLVLGSLPAFQSLAPVSLWKAATEPPSVPPGCTTTASPITSGDCETPQ